MRTGRLATEGHQRGLERARVVQEGLITVRLNGALLLPGLEVVHASHGACRSRATLDGQLHELLERLGEGTDVGEVATRRSLGGTLELRRRALAVLELHQVARVERGRDLLTERGVRVRERAVGRREHLEAIGAVLLDGRLETHVGDEVRARDNLAFVGELGLVRHTEFVGGAGQGVLAGRILLVASGREIGVAIVDTGADVDAINGSDVLHRQRGDHTRLLEVGLHLATPRQTRARLRLEHRRRLLLVEKGVLARARVGVEDTVRRTAVDRLGHIGAEEGNHVVVARRRLDQGHTLCLGGKGQWANEGFLWIKFGRTLLTFLAVVLRSERIAQRRESKKKGNFHLFLRA